MSLSPAAKQARFREKHLHQGENRRLQLVISLHAKLALGRLARHREVTLAVLTIAVCQHPEVDSRICCSISIDLNEMVACP